MTKVLIATPICKSKDYCWEEYLSAVKKLKLPRGWIGHHLIVDNSDDCGLQELSEKEQCIYMCINTEKKPMDKLVKSRNAAIDYAAFKEYDWLFFVDSDVIVPEDAVLKLLDNDIPSDKGSLYFINQRLVSGFYPLISDVGLPEPTGMILNSRGVYKPIELDKHDIYEVDLIGMGCCLIHKDLFVHRFRCERDKNDFLIKSEDMCYCADLKKLGVIILFDTRVIAKHKIVGEHWDYDTA